jgi:L-asparaginase II
VASPKLIDRCLAEAASAAIVGGMGRGPAELALAERSGYVESRHLGAAAVCDPQGRLTASLGDPALPVYLRSTAKPLQAMAVATLGADAIGSGGAPIEWPRAALAAACGSHDGEPVHVETVLAVLDRAGLGEPDLRCPPSFPRDRRGAGDTPRAVWHNCSGKHAWMLAGAVANGWPVAGYLDPDGPLQKAVLGTVARLAGATPAHVGVDGCGAPTPVLPLTGLATAFARLADGEQETAGVVEAVRSFPVLLGGTRALDTAILRVTGGRVLAKVGAEAVYAAVDLERGLACALKVTDGSARAGGPALLAVLRALGWLDGGELAELEPVACPAVMGGGHAVGRVTPARVVLDRPGMDPAGFVVEDH